MSGLILPRRSNRFAEQLRQRDEKTFRNQAAMAHAVSQAVQQTCGPRGLNVPQVLDCLLTVLVSFVQSQAPATEWGSVGEVLSHEMQARLTVTGDSGEDDYRRKMV